MVTRVMGKFFKTAQSGGFAETDDRTIKKKVKDSVKGKVDMVKRNPYKSSFLLDMIADEIYPTEHGIMHEGVN